MTILVGADVVQIIREQQEWVRQRWNLGPDGTARYLFPRMTGNRKATRAWETGHYDLVLRQLSEAAGLRDSDGRELSYSRSHRLRHTKATTLLNAGAPIHVVQRYPGHRSPEMTMRYAATLATTAEREFLAMVKIGRDGRQAGMDRRDMLDLLQLDRRTDRVLPNGYCLLPPVRPCDKGNACHGCGHFATDRSHLPEIRRQLTATEQLIEHRKAQHQPRDRHHHQQTGNTMTATATAGERRADALRKAAQAKRQAAVTRADTAIRKLIKNQQDINFRSVARAAGVSLDFLYGNDDLRKRIEKLRTQQNTRPAPDPAPGQADSSDIVHILTAKLCQERDTRRTAVSQLEEQLAAAHGELLRLRRLLQQHGISTA